MYLSWKGVPPKPCQRLCDKCVDLILLAFFHKKTTLYRDVFKNLDVFPYFCAENLLNRKR